VEWLAMHNSSPCSVSVRTLVVKVAGVFRAKTLVAALVFCTMTMPYLLSALHNAKALAGKSSKGSFLALI